MRVRFSTLVVGPILVLLAIGAGCSDSPERQSSGLFAHGPSPTPTPNEQLLTLTRIDPPTGITNYPQAVALSGTGFKGGATVAFGGVPGTQAVVTSARITITTPAHDTGAVDVVVTNPDGQSATLPGAFSFHPVTLTANPLVAAGDQLTASWVAMSRSGHGSDWIGLFALGVSNFDYLEGWWVYTGGQTSGTAMFPPRAAGEYEFRYLLDDGYDDVARVPVSIR